MEITREDLLDNHMHGAADRTEIISLKLRIHGHDTTKS